MAENDTSFDWAEFGKKEYAFAVWILIIARVIIVAASVTVLVLVTGHRKRTEFLYIMCPLSFLLSGIFGVWYSVKLYTTKSDGDIESIQTIALLLAFHYIFFSMGHQYFASQYLQTSFVLPIMFQEAKFEFIVRDSAPVHNSIGKSEWDINKLQKELAD